MSIHLLSKKILFIIVAGILFFAQSGFSQRIDSTLQVYADSFQQERIYIHFDKPAYAPGETVWFKAYIMAGIEPSDLSKNFYLDWADTDGKVLLHTIFPVLQSTVRGQFEVPADYKSSSIRIMGYTKWMLNFDSAFLYSKEIRILQNTASKNTVKKSIASIQFFPEGGDAIINLKNKIAFKANDQFGKPVKVKGVIQNAKGAVVDSFKAMHDGMGYFFIEPKANETYTAKWKDEQGNSYQTALPAARPDGILLQMHNTGKKKGFIVSRTAQAAENLKQLHIVASMHQQMVYMANIRLSETQSIGGAIPTEQFPSGVMQVTVFDVNWVPVAERITFINNGDAVFSPEVGFSTLGFSKRGKNVLEISMPPNMSANLSVAVTDAGIGADSSDNIISRLLLTGDLKGNVYKPYYYFSNDSDSTINHLDLVMLTNGWRRFNWAKVVQGKFPDIKYPKDTSFLSFSGKVFGASPGQLREAGDLYFILRGKDSSQQILSLPIASDGTFQDPSLIFFDTLKIYYQFQKNRSFSDMSELRFFNNIIQKPAHVYVDKDNNIQLQDTSGNYRNFFIAQQRARLEELMKGTTLAEVTVQTRTKSPVQLLDEKYASGFFKGGDGYQFDITDDALAQSSPNVFTYLQGRVAGLQITTNGPQASLSWRGGSPQVYLDEIPTDISNVGSISMSNVAYIKVFRPPFMGGFGGGSGGAIAVYTRKGGDVKTEPGKGLPYKNVAGYTAIREFYSPNYGTFNEKNEREDLRTTLYWNPMVLTDPENHRIQLSFYNNDVTDSFRVIVEGMSPDGKLTRVEKVVE